MSLTRTMQLRQGLSRVCSLCSHISNVKPSHHISKSARSAGILSQLLKSQTMTLSRNLSTSEDPSVDVSNYPSEVEVSYEDFKYVENLLPQSTVPAVPHHESYPTPSGWMPPNDELRSQQPYLVRRTRNHVLPVYAVQNEVWTLMKHHVVIKNIEGDIWKLELDLRNYIQAKTHEKKIITQVHEVSRCIRIRGQHRALIADFLLENGM